MVIFTTYLTLVLGELVPKQLALRSPEMMAARVARPVAVLSRIVAPGGLAARQILQRRAAAFRPARGSRRQSVTEEELKALLIEGAKTGVLEIEERDMIERVLRLRRQAGARDHDATHRTRLDRPHPSGRRPSPRR